MLRIHNIHNIFQFLEGLKNIQFGIFIKMRSPMVSSKRWDNMEIEDIKTANTQFEKKNK